MTAGHPQEEQRQHVRFQVKHPAFVFNGLNVGRIVNICLDGLAFTYDGQATWPQQLTCLDLLIDNETFLTAIPVRVVSDVVISEESRYQLVTRQCGVQFGRLSPDQLHRLEYFIRINSQEGLHPTLCAESLLTSLGYD